MERGRRGGEPNTALPVATHGRFLLRMWAIGRSLGRIGRPWSADAGPLWWRSQAALCGSKKDRLESPEDYDRRGPPLGLLHPIRYIFSPYSPLFSALHFP